MCIYIYIYTHIYIHTHTHTHIYIYIYVYTYTHTHTTHTHTHTHTPFFFPGCGMSDAPAKNSKSLTCKRVSPPLCVPQVYPKLLTSTKVLALLVQKYKC